MRILWLLETGRIATRGSNRPMTTGRGLAQATRAETAAEDAPRGDQGPVEGISAEVS